MPYPVPPPEPPPIVQSLPPDALSAGSTSLPASLFATQSVTAKTLAAPTPPETLAPDPSRSNAAKSADLLGPSVSVGYAVETATSLKQPDAQVLPLQLAQSPNPNSSEPPNSPPAELDFQAPLGVPQQTTPLTPRQQQLPPVSPPAAAPVPIQLPSTQQPQSQPGQSTPPSTAPQRERIIELTSDRQEYDQQRQIVTAEGHVMLRFDGALVDADRLQVNVPNGIVVGDGNVALTRGQQVLRGERFTYNFIQDNGEFLNARGEIYLPTTSSDFSGTLPTDVSAGRVPLGPASDRTRANQPLQQVTTTGGIGVTVGGVRNVSNIAPPQQGGQVRRVRFEAKRIEYYPRGWRARNVRITNDPFSPPELELRADQVILAQETPLRQRIRTVRPRLVFNQRLALPIPRDEAVIDRNRRQVSPALAQIGYDGSDRGGIFIERGFTPINTEQLQLRLTPQFLAQRAVQNSGNIPALFGLRARLDGNLGSRTVLTGSANFTSLDLNNIDNSLRASLRLRQTIGTRLPHTLTLESSYRDRLYNGSLGFQTVQSSIGGVITSPVIPLGKSGINLSYQAGAQYITANTDRPQLLAPVRRNDRVSLSRVQGSAALSRGFPLWQGRTLPATATEGLKYTPSPVLPYVVAFAGVTGTSGYYSNGDNQSLITGTVGLQGQFGHFSRPFLDYTGFNITYSQGILNGLSPFLFDRAADTKVLSAGFSQQIYGPLRLGVQTSLNLDTGRSYSTDYILEYSRRSYGITLRYNPDVQLGSLSLRISDFNWVGGSDPFSESDVKPVVGGVRQDNY